jgi:hypothetical protein
LFRIQAETETKTETKTVVCVCVCVWCRVGDRGSDGIHSFVDACHERLSCAAPIQPTHKRHAENMYIHVIYMTYYIYNMLYIYIYIYACTYIHTYTYTHACMHMYSYTDRVRQTDGDRVVASVLKECWRSVVGVL